ncbi:MAG: 50S ribosomal protein L21 [Phycisphaerales bacterium]
MYAVIEDSGGQFKVSEGDIIRVDIRELPENATELSFDRVLYVSDNDANPKIGTPTLANATVKADILTEVRGDKIVIIKYKHRKGYRRKQGHRQRFLRVKITGINA